LPTGSAVVGFCREGVNPATLSHLPNRYNLYADTHSEVRFELLYSIYMRIVANKKNTTIPLFAAIDLTTVPLESL
jgi:hypothetical protein